MAKCVPGTYKMHMPRHHPAARPARFLLLGRPRARYCIIGYQELATARATNAWRSVAIAARGLDNEQKLEICLHSLHRPEWNFVVARAPGNM